MSKVALIHRKRYPKSFEYLWESLPRLKPESGEWLAFLQNSHLTTEEAISAVTLDATPPLIFVSSLGTSTWGLFRTEVPDRIEISADVLAHFEAQPDSQIAKNFLRAKVLHEMCHWGCFKKNVQDEDEAGEKFETAVFEKELRPWWTSNASDGESLDASGVFADAQSRCEELRRQLGTVLYMPGRLEDPAHAVFGGKDVGPSLRRGFRNNNPGNIKVSISKWEGLADPARQMDFQRQETTFCVFREPEWGLRAMAYILRKYKSEYQCDTPRKIISRWAPGSDNNDVESYSGQVAAALGVRRDDYVDAREPSTLDRLVRAIVRHENGKTPPYANVQYEAATKLLGL